MKITVNHVFIQVADQDQGLAFYRDALGFELRVDAPLGPFRWLTVSPPSQPELEIVLEAPEMGRSPEDARTLRELGAKGALTGVLFSTDDVDATFEQLRAAGTEVLQEPMDQPYGVRDCAFRDPFGNHLRFARDLPA